MRREANLRRRADDGVAPTRPSRNDVVQRRNRRPVTGSGHRECRDGVPLVARIDVNERRAQTQQPEPKAKGRQGRRPPTETANDDGSSSGLLSFLTRLLRGSRAEGHDELVPLAQRLDNEDHVVLRACELLRIGDEGDERS